MFVVPHYGRVGHTTMGYRQWWYSSNAEYWDVAHPWQAVSGSRCNGRAGRHFVPRPFSVIFCLDHVPANWQELVKPRSLSGDEAGMKLLSLKIRTRSFFDNLEATFGWSEMGVDPSHEEGLASAPPARIEGESRSDLSGWANRAPRAPASVKPKSTPPKERQDKEREREREKGGESLRPSPLLGNEGAIRIRKTCLQQRCLQCQPIRGELDQELIGLQTLLQLHHLQFLQQCHVRLIVGLGG
ncbi:hypothetical protein AMTR_s00120p00066930 [Amborella trichopoda]|uniref:Uncharacterized protein n=1 Tax=Amborella trichopoda TaxID=13333 RepID=W1NP27_AMBTC|nr:hypothetical protein AMTR_s00120p00066930 [Amborella trichopoda]